MNKQEADTVLTFALDGAVRGVGFSHWSRNTVNADVSACNSPRRVPRTLRDPLSRDMGLTRRPPTGDRARLAGLRWRPLLLPWGVQ